VQALAVPRQAASKKPDGPRVMPLHKAESKVDEMIDDDAVTHARLPRVKTLHSVKTLHEEAAERQGPVPTLRRQGPVPTLRRQAQQQTAGEALGEMGETSLKEDVPRPQTASELIQEGNSKATLDTEGVETLKLLLESGDADLLA